MRRLLRPLSPFRFGAVLLVVGMFTASRRANAAPSAADLKAARALFSEGSADERAGRWEEALEKMRRASAVKMTPGLRFHIAVCEERTGKLVAALADYTAAQVAARAEGNRDVLGLVSEPLLSLKDRLPTLTVHVPAQFSTGDARAEIRLDGTVVALESLGLPVPVDVGSHTIQASAVGQTPYAMTVTVVERQAATVDVQFSPLPGYVDPAQAAQAAATPTAATQAHAKEEARPSRTLAIVTTVGAVVLVGGGIGAYAASGSDQAYWDKICGTAKAREDAARSSVPCGNATPVHAWDATALGAWIAGAGLGITAVVLWTRPSDHGSDSGHAVLRAGPGSLAIVGSF